MTQKYLYRFGIVASLAIATAVAIALRSAVDSQPPPRFSLEALRVWRGTGTDAPFAAATIDGNVVAFVQANRQTILLDVGGQHYTLAPFAESDISAIASGPGGFWIAAKRDLFYLDLYTHDIIPVRLAHQVQGEIRSLAATDNSLWAVSVLQRRARLYEIQLNLPIHPDTLLRTASTPLAEPDAVLHRYDSTSVVASTRARPFRVHRIVEGLQIAETYEPISREVDEGTQTRYIASAIIPLDATHLVQWRVDLKSLTRHAVLISFDHSVAERLVEISEPISLIHGLPDGKVLAGRERANGREIILYRIRARERG